MAIYVYTNQRDGGIAHIPSQQEFEDLKSIMEGLSLTTGNDYKTKLHMPLAGIRYYSNVSRRLQDSQGHYWSSSPSDYHNPRNAHSFLFSSSIAGRDYEQERSNSISMRCFLNTYITPDNTRTVEAGTLGSAGVFYNATLGVISVTNGSDKNITMYDKNIGATEVYNDGDTLTEANMGKMFQRGNYYGFVSTGTISDISSTQVDTTGYGGSNPYSSSTFITKEDRSNPSNDNLRAGSGDEYFVIN